MLNSIEKLAKLAGLGVVDNDKNPWNRKVLTVELSKNKDKDYLQVTLFPGEIEVGVHGAEGLHFIKRWPDKLESIHEIIDYLNRNKI